LPASFFRELILETEKAKGRSSYGFFKLKYFYGLRGKFPYPSNEMA